MALASTVKNTFYLGNKLKSAEVHNFPKSKKSFPHVKKAASAKQLTYFPHIVAFTFSQIKSGILIFKQTLHLLLKCKYICSYYFNGFSMVFQFGCHTQPLLSVLDEFISGKMWGSQIVHSFY